ncbi:MAG: VCBS repeat-containing protein [Proteobacteria bacterium]|nr:VCBS repeat-containing protein [Pseudomonadota bacterium]
MISIEINRKRPVSRLLRCTQRQFRCLYLGLLASFAISACGGGSSGGGGTPAPPPPLPPPPPPPPPVTLGITDENAVEVGLRAFDAIELPEYANLLLIGSVLAVVENAMSDVESTCSMTGSVTRSIDDADSSGNVSSNDTVTFSFNGCNGRTGNVRLVIDTVVFSQLNLRQLDGSVTANFSTTVETATYTAQATHEMRFLNAGTVTARSIDAEVTLTVEDSMTGGGPMSDRATGLNVTSTTGGSDEYEIAIDGQMDSDSLGGRFDFDTREPFIGARGNHPDQGIVRMTGVGSWVEFTANTDPYHSRRVANFQVAADATGGPGERIFVSWRRLSAGLLFSVVSPFDPAEDGPFNQAPYIRELSLEPQSPGTMDPVTVVVDVLDPERSALEITYVWYRNGEQLAGQTAQTLPSVEYVKDDVVSAEVTASDGQLSSSLRYDITIADTPPELSLLGDPPTVISHGETASFRIGFTDVDNDPMPDTPLQIVHGPSGMEVDSQGNVTFTPMGPRFDRTMAFNWAVNALELDAPAISGTLRVEYPTATYPLMRTGLLVDIDAGDFIVDDLDSDGADDILIANLEHAVYELKWSGDTYEQSWVYPFQLALEDLMPEALPDDQRNRTSTAVTALANGDVDVDGLHEIFLAVAGVIVKLDGAERRVSAVAPLENNFTCRRLEYVDAASDRDAGLICITGRAFGPVYAIYVLDPADLSIKAHKRIDQLGVYTAVANVDGDPAMEIIDSDGRVFDGDTLELEWFHLEGFADEGLIPYRFEAGDIDGDGISEIVGIDFVSVFIYSGVSRSLVKELPFDRRLYALHVTDIDNDGVEEIIVAWESMITAHRYNASTGSLDDLFEIDVGAFDAPFGTVDWVSLIGTGDTDGDGTLEYVWAQESALSITAWNPEFKVEWSGHGKYDFKGPYKGGEMATLGPGYHRLIFSGTSELNFYGGNDEGPRLMAVDPATGRYDVTPHDIGTRRSAPIAVSDIDLDGVDEVLLSTHYDNQPFLTAQDIAGNRERWRSASGTWNVAQIDNEDVTGDGRDEVIALTSHPAENRIRVYDIARETVTWESDPNRSAFTLVDLDGDGRRELIVGTENRVQSDAGVTLYRQDGNGGFEQAAFVDLDTNHIGDVVAGDIDGDGEVEIFALQLDSDRWIYRLNNDLEVLGRFATTSDTARLYLGPSGSRRRNLILSQFDRYEIGSGPRLYGVDAFTGAEVWRSPLLPGVPSRHSLHYIDSNDDGEPEIVLATEGGVMITR